MKMNLALLCCTSLTLLAGCGGGEGQAGIGREPDEYVGCSTDESWVSFDEASNIVSDTEAPAFTAPATSGTTLTNVASDFAWKVTPTIAGTAAGDSARTCEQWNTGFATLHLPPVSGTLYDLQLSVGGEVKHRVITTLQKWKASDGVWASFAGQTVTASLRRMTVLQNHRKEGPFIGSASFSFSVAK